MRCQSPTQASCRWSAPESRWLGERQLRATKAASRMLTAALEARKPGCAALPAARVRGGMGAGCACAAYEWLLQQLLLFPQALSVLHSVEQRGGRGALGRPAGRRVASKRRRAGESGHGCLQGCSRQCCDQTTLLQLAWGGGASGQGFSARFDWREAASPCTRLPRRCASCEERNWPPGSPHGPHLGRHGEPSTQQPPAHLRPPAPAPASLPAQWSEAQEHHGEQAAGGRGCWAAARWSALWRPRRCSRRSAAPSSSLVRRQRPQAGCQRAPCDSRRAAAPRRPGDWCTAPSIRCRAMGQRHGPASLADPACGPGSAGRRRCQQRAGNPAAQGSSGQRCDRRRRQGAAEDCRRPCGPRAAVPPAPAASGRALFAAVCVTFCAAAALPVRWACADQGRTLLARCCRCRSSCRRGWRPLCWAAACARSGWTPMRSTTSPWRTPVSRGTSLAHCAVAGGMRAHLWRHMAGAGELRAAVLALQQASRPSAAWPSCSGGSSSKERRQQPQSWKHGSAAWHGADAGDAVQHKPMAAWLMSAAGGVAARRAGGAQQHGAARPGNWTSQQLAVDSRWWPQAGQSVPPQSPKLPCHDRPARLLLSHLRTCAAICAALQARTCASW